MLNTKKIDTFQNKFNLKKLNFYGSIIWIVPLLKFLFSDIVISAIIRKFDKIINVKKSAFKFTLMMQKK